MSILTIDTYPAPVLKKKAEKITRIDELIRKLAEDMLETMYHAPGVGLAAPQIGSSLSLVVADAGAGEDRSPKPWILVNPEIIAREGKAGIVEGCLSVPGYTAEVPRYEKILVRAYSLDEKELELNLEGFPAIVLQHELDHLQGILFIDRISRLKRSIYERKLRKGNLETS
ncbi:MAG TPA: peptide deformylase [Proteobacteria bacterium]|mgnify:CR=1 FL=1|nr:peptide deformylase [Pseudomonadota bacterium]